MILYIYIQLNELDAWKFPVAKNFLFPVALARTSPRTRSVNLRVSSQPG